LPRTKDLHRVIAAIYSTSNPYLDTCPKNDVISFSLKGLCFKDTVRVGVGLGLKVRVSGIAFSTKRPFGKCPRPQVSIPR